MCVLKIWIIFLSFAAQKKWFSVSSVKLRRLNTLTPPSPLCKIKKFQNFFRKWKLCNGNSINCHRQVPDIKKSNLMHPEPIWIVIRTGAIDYHFTIIIIIITSTIWRGTLQKVNSVVITTPSSMIHTPLWAYWSRNQ